MAVLLHEKIGIEKVQFSKSGGTSTYNFGQSIPLRDILSTENVLRKLDKVEASLQF